jgi:hypothetical protein
MLNEAELEELRVALVECERLLAAAEDTARVTDHEPQSLAFFSAASGGQQLAEAGA